MCLCQQIAPVANTTEVHILQHPQERRHALGTTRLLRLGLDRVQVHVLEIRSTSSAVEPIDFPPGTGLLYLSDGATDLATLPPEDRPDHLVLIDGTWDQAHRIHRDNPWLSELPHYRLNPEQGSNYRIRVEPRAECLSTLESTVAALRQLEPELDGTDGLLEAFDAMIDDQIDAAAHAESYPRQVRRRQKTPRSLPAPLLQPRSQLLVVYTEEAPDLPDEHARPLRISAVSLDQTRVFDRLVALESPPDAYLLGQMGIDPTELRRAQPLDAVLADFDAFCRASPSVLLSWTTRTQGWLQARFEDRPCPLLKGVWANVHKTRVPALGTLAAELGLRVGEPVLRGRAGRRLTLALRVAQHLLDEADAAALVVVERTRRDAILPLRELVLGDEASGPQTFSGDLSPTTRHWAARIDGEVVGCVSVMQLRGLALRGMAVRPDLQDRGIGAKMMRTLATEVREPMWCNARLAAVPFYRRVGWVETGPVFEMDGRGPHQRLVWSPPSDR